MDDSDKVFAAARDGKALSLFALLCHKHLRVVGNILSAETEEDGQKTTPFLIAARNGHNKVVSVLLKNFVVDIEQVGTVKFDGFVIEGATALWCAAGAGHLDVVKTLIESGADVNHPTFSNSTPLRAACFDGRLDIVKYLIEHKADLTITNKYHNSCLMIASYKGHAHVVAYLLQMGADPDAKAHCGATALHFAAERGFLQITKDLYKHGATMLKNDQGMLPLSVAADSSHAEIVEFFLRNNVCTTLEQIEALELLGASYANDKDNYNIDKCYHYLWLAMQGRYSNPQNILHKVIRPPVEAYEHRVECQNIEELEEIKDDHDSLHMEALMVRERILGESNAEIPHPIIYRGAVFADTAHFDRCITLWIRALDLRQENDRTISKDLLRFAQVFSQMIHVGVCVDFHVGEYVFECALKELHSNQERLAKAPTKEELESQADIIELNIHTALYLIVILTKIRCSKEEEFRLCKQVYRFNRLNLRLRSKKDFTPLHMACDETTIVDDFHVSDIVLFPSDVLAGLLLKCGANPNITDAEGNTPLHLIVRYNKPISDFMTLHNIIMLLTDAGVHVDRANRKGQTCLSIATTGVAEIILRARRMISLKCIAARAVKEYGIPYKGHIPLTLEEFVEFH